MTTVTSDERDQADPETAIRRIATLRAAALSALEQAVARGSVYAAVYVVRETGGLWGDEWSDDDVTDDPDRLLDAVREAEDRNVRAITRQVDRQVDRQTRR